ncbi:MAG: efflux RND transporter periplasmic adaptor subunit [bacterium]
MTQLNPKKFALAACLCLLALVLAFGMAYGQDRGPGPGKGKRRNFPPRPVVVSTVRAVSELPTFKGNGLLAPREKALLSVDFAGRATKIFKRAGDFVERGELLAELTNVDLELNLTVLQARLREVEAERAMSRQKLARAQSLFRRKLAPAEQFENERAGAAVMEARVASVKVQVARLETQLSLMKVRAPISGQIVRKDLEIGQWVSPNKPIFEIYNYERLELMVGVPGRFLNKISTSVPITITIPEIGKKLRGRIEAVVRHVQQGSGNFLLRVEAKNPDRSALSGLMAQVEVPVGLAGTAMAVPRDAIVRKRGKTMVVVVRDGKAQLVPIRVTGNLSNGSVMVAGKLKPNEQVVVRGNERLPPGTAVRVTGKM